MTAILNMIYCFLMDMIQSFRDVWIVGWDSLLVPVDAHAYLNGHRGSHRAKYCERICVAARGDRPLASDRDYRRRHGHSIPLQSVPFVRWGS